MDIAVRLVRGRRGELLARVAVPLLPALLAVGLYARTAAYGLVDYDDPWLVGANTLLSRPTASGLATVLFDLGAETRLRLGAEYLPVRDLSVLLDLALFGRRFGGHHATNVLLYAALCAAIAAALAAWTGRRAIALGAALLFAAHPIHVESVAWLSERKGLLSALFVALSMLSFRGFVARGRALCLAATAACLGLATLSKAGGAAGVGLLAALLLYLPRVPSPAPAPASRRRAWAGLAVIAAVVAAASAPVYAVGARLVVDASGAAAPLLERLSIACAALALQVQHLLLLGELGIAYPLARGAVPPHLTLAGALLLAALAGAAVVGARRAPLLGLGAASLLVLLTPTLQLLVPLQNLVADRYALLPSLGFCVAISGVLLGLRPGGRLMPVLLALLTLAAVARTAVQIPTWSSSEALYRQALAAHPKNAQALVQLSTIEAARGRSAEAWRDLDLAEAADPRNPRVPLHRALLLDRLGRRDEAIATLERAAQRDPSADRARANLALLLSARGWHEEALRRAREAVRTRPLLEHNQRTLGIVALGAGRSAEAEAALRRALALDPDSAGSRYHLGLALAGLGRTEEARAELERALALRPSFASARALLEALSGRGTPSRSGRSGGP
jgi:protein O-mannosyl-transferase